LGKNAHKSLCGVAFWSFEFSVLEHEDFGGAVVVLVQPEGGVFPSWGLVVVGAAVQRGNQGVGGRKARQ